MSFLSGFGTDFLYYRVVLYQSSGMWQVSSSTMIARQCMKNAHSYC